MSASKKSTPDRHQQHRARQLVAEHEITYQQALQRLPQYDLQSALTSYSHAQSWDEITAAGKQARIHPIVLVAVARATGVSCPLFGNRNMPKKSISVEALLTQVTSTLAAVGATETLAEHSYDGHLANRLSPPMQASISLAPDADTNPIVQLADKTHLGVMPLVYLAKWLGTPVSTRIYNKLMVPIPGVDVGPSIYITEQRLTLVDLWPKCKTKEQKAALASKLGIPSLLKAYNLYSCSSKHRMSPDEKVVLATQLGLTKQGLDAMYKLYARGGADG